MKRWEVTRQLMDDGFSREHGSPDNASSMLAPFFVLHDSVLVNRLRVRTKVSVEGLCVRTFGPKTMGRRFDTISSSWLTV
jgi:hypothetical protein